MKNEDEDPDLADVPEIEGFDPEEELSAEALEAAVEGAEGLDDEDDDEEPEEGEEPGAADGEEGEPQAKKKPEEEEEPPGPDVPAPSRKKMLEALEWAFAGEEDVTPELLERFCEHALLLLEHNRKVNLTAIIDPKEVAAKHYLDSWRVTRLVSLLGRRVVDLGTGGGFPGIVLALAEPNASVVLIDSRKKKVDFLEAAIEKLGLKNATAVWARAEEFLTRERCDIVVVRAVSSVRENVRTLRKVRHALKDLVMLKGTSWSREVRAGERESERLGFHLDTVWEHELPEEMGGRAILIYQAPGGQGL